VTVDYTVAAARAFASISAAQARHAPGRTFRFVFCSGHASELAYCKNLWIMGPTRRAKVISDPPISKIPVTLTSAIGSGRKSAFQHCRSKSGFFRERYGPTLRYTSQTAYMVDGIPDRARLTLHSPRRRISHGHGRASQTRVRKSNTGCFGPRFRSYGAQTSRPVVRNRDGGMPPQSKQPASTLYIAPKFRGDDLLIMPRRQEGRKSVCGVVVDGHVLHQQRKRRRTVVRASST
jgi:hypothetical protein